MKKITVKNDNSDSNSFDSLFVYSRCIALLRDLRLTQGPVAVSSTLKRHPIVYNYLLTYQKNSIIDLEREISNYSECYE